MATCVIEKNTNDAVEDEDAVEDADEVEDEDEESIGLKMTMMMVMKMKIFCLKLG